MIAFHRSRPSSSVSPPNEMPALLNMRSSRPAVATTSSTSACTAAASVTSTVAGRALPGPVADAVAAVAAAASPSRSAQRTSTPSRTSAYASARPMPDPAPVTMAWRVPAHGARGSAAHPNAFAMWPSRSG